MAEQAIKELLRKENAEFRRAHDDHQACDKALDAIRGKTHLSPADVDEERELKKKKLVLKDRMYRVMAERLRTG